MSDEKLSAAINELLEKTYRPGEPGAAVIVVREGKVLLRKGYGKANLELGVPIEPDMVFRLGSITKQFTAVAILMLAEQGKLSLDDDLTKFLPDYPTTGQKITIEHLLTHTSGIKSYTSLPEWLAQWRKDIPLGELIALFKDKPMDFAPGERWAYNNSAYVLLGAVIEKASGQTYREFIEKQIFTPLGMKQSFYDDTARLIPRRVTGYSKSGDGYVNAAYLSMTQPHAAGALVSSVDDLALWDAALYTDKLLKQETLRRAWTPGKLNDGNLTRYGYGWGASSYEGHRIIEHGGGINGFSTDALRLPDDRIFVAVLTNKDSGNPGPSEVAFEIAALTVGKPYREPTAIKLPPDALDKYVGVYGLDRKEEAVIRREGEKLLAQFPRAGKVEIFPSSATEFFIKGSRNRLSFTRNAAGEISGLVLHGTYGPDQEAAKTDKPLPAERQAVAIDPALYDRYVGVYELAPGFSLTISREDDKLSAQATGQPKLELFPESRTKFFAKGVDVQIEFVVEESGKASSMVLHQGGRKLPGKKIK
ncbi:MAG: serine hydrolase [Pyrinomonadaceae bacterium]